MFKLELKTILSSICQPNSLLHQQTWKLDAMLSCVACCISIFVAIEKLKIA